RWRARCWMPAQGRHDEGKKYILNPLAGPVLRYILAASCNKEEHTCISYFKIAAADRAVIAGRSARGRASRWAGAWAPVAKVAAAAGAVGWSTAASSGSCC